MQLSIKNFFDSYSNVKSQIFEKLKMLSYKITSILFEIIGPNLYIDGELARARVRKTKSERRG